MLVLGSGAAWDTHWGRLSTVVVFQSVPGFCSLPSWFPPGSSECYLVFGSNELLSQKVYTTHPFWILRVSHFWPSHMLTVAPVHRSRPVLTQFGIHNWIYFPHCYPPIVLGCLTGHLWGVSHYNARAKIKLLFVWTCLPPHWKPPNDKVSNKAKNKGLLFFMEIFIFY